MTITDDQKKRFTVARMIYAIMTFAMPLAYLALPLALKLPELDPTANTLVFRILLIIALVEPMLIPVIEKAQLKQLRQNKTADPAATFLTLTIIRAALVDAIYLYGVVVYLTTHNFDWMLYFYPIGVITAIVYFPRESAFESFIEKVKMP